MPYLGLSSFIVGSADTRAVCVRGSIQKIRPKLASVKRNEEGERSEDFLFERSELKSSANRTNGVVRQVQP